MSKSKVWFGRFATAALMPGLCFARIVIAWVPFGIWRKSLGLVATENRENLRVETLAQAQFGARRVDRAADRLPFDIKCLPRAMLVSWQLRMRNVGHAVVFAVRPDHRRGEEDTLHAWVEIGGSKIIGDLPGPWIETLRLGDGSA